MFSEQLNNMNDDLIILIENLESMPIKDHDTKLYVLHLLRDATFYMALAINKERVAVND